MSSVRPRQVVRERHLETLLSAYADRSLPADVLLACDQHVAICPCCRAAAEDERRLLSSLRTAVTPGVPSRLESALLDLGTHATLQPSNGGVAPLAVMHRYAPPMHRSPVRAAMLASLAAGASAAAAWSFGVSSLGTPGGSSAVVRLPSAASTVSSPIAGSSSGQAVAFLSLDQVSRFSAPTGLATSHLRASGHVATPSVASAPAVSRSVPALPRSPK